MSPGAAKPSPAAGRAAGGRGQAGGVGGEDGVEGVGGGVDGQGWGWVVVGEGASAEQGVEVGAVVGVTVADVDRVNLPRVVQAGNDGVAGVDEQAEAVFF